MKSPSRSLLAELRDAAQRNILYANPVLTTALGICTIVAAATTLENGWILSQLLALVLIPECLLSSACFSRLPRYLRTPAVAVSAAGFYTLGMLLLQWRYGSMTLLFRYYLPLIALNSMMLSRAVRYAPRQSLRTALIDSATCAVGFGVAACLVGGVRELFQSGTLGGVTLIHTSPALHMAQVPFFGFIVLGFVCALWRAIRLRHIQKEGRKPR